MTQRQKIEDLYGMVSELEHAIKLLLEEEMDKEEDVMNQRMDIIGQNGNTGDHYEALKSIKINDPYTL